MRRWKVPVTLVIALLAGCTSIPVQGEDYESVTSEVNQTTVHFNNDPLKVFKGFNEDVFAHNINDLVVNAFNTIPAQNFESTKVNDYYQYLRPLASQDFLDFMDDGAEGTGQFSQEEYDAFFYNTLFSVFPLEIVEGRDIDGTVRSHTDGVTQYTINANGKDIPVEVNALEYSTEDTPLEPEIKVRFEIPVQVKDMINGETYEYVSAQTWWLFPSDDTHQEFKIIRAERQEVQAPKEITTD